MRDGADSRPSELAAAEFGRAEAFGVGLIAELILTQQPPLAQEPAQVSSQVLG